MAAFLANTWLLWYALAVVIILRWFHLAVATGDVEPDVPELDRSDRTIARKAA